MASLGYEFNLRVMIIIFLWSLHSLVSYYTHDKINSNPQALK